MRATKAEAARIAWHEHQMDHGCTTLDCAEAQLRYQLYLAAIREEHGDARGGGQPDKQPLMDTGTRVPLVTAAGSFTFWLDMIPLSGACSAEGFSLSSQHGGGA